LKAGKVGWTAEFGLECVKMMLPAFAARQRDVRLEGASFGEKAARLGGRGDALLKQEQFGREPNAGDEDSGALEAVQSFKADGNGRRVKGAQARDDTGELIRAGVAEELQSDVPGFGRGPAEAVPGGAKPRGGRAEFVNHRGGQGYSDKETHTRIIQDALQKWKIHRNLRA